MPQSHSPNHIGTSIANEAKDVPHARAPQIEARLFVFSDGFVYAASAVSSAQTSRHAGVVLISLDDTPIHVSFAEPRTDKPQNFFGRVIALAPGVKRSIQVGPSGALSIHFDPSHPVYFPMSECLGSTGGKTIPYRHFRHIEANIHECRHARNEDIARNVFEKCAQAITKLCPQTAIRDQRIVELLGELQSLSPLDYEFAKILETYNLSASRFSHLFTANAGLSLRSFLQWRKIKEAIAMFETGISMTEIAHASGFSDSAHFCRTFNKCLGLKPSMFGPGRPVNVQVMDSALEGTSAYA